MHLPCQNTLENQLLSILISQTKISVLYKTSTTNFDPNSAHIQVENQPITNLERSCSFWFVHLSAGPKCTCYPDLLSKCSDLIISKRCILVLYHILQKQRVFIPLQKYLVHFMHNKLPRVTYFRWKDIIWVINTHDHVERIMNKLEHSALIFVSAI